MGPRPLFFFNPRYVRSYNNGPIYYAVYNPLSYPSFPSYFVASWFM